MLNLSASEAAGFRRLRAAARRTVPSALDRRSLRLSIASSLGLSSLALFALPAQASTKGQAVLDLLSEDRYDDARKKCEKWEATDELAEGPLRNACADAYWPLAEAKNSVEGWIDYRKVWLGTEAMPEALEREGTAALRAVDTSLPEADLLKLAERYAGTRVEDQFIGLAADAAVRDATSPAEAVGAATRYPDHGGLTRLVENYPQAFLKVTVDDHGVVVRLDPPVTLHADFQPQVSWVARAADYNVTDWSEAVGSYLRDHGLTDEQLSGLAERRQAEEAQPTDTEAEETEGGETDAAETEAEEAETEEEGSEEAETEEAETEEAELEAAEATEPDPAVHEFTIIGDIPRCYDPSFPEGWTPAALVAIGTGQVSLAAGWEDGCGPDASPTFTIFERGKLAAISLGPGHVISISTPLPVGLSGEPADPLLHGDALYQQAGEAWIVRPLSGGSPWLTTTEPASPRGPIPAAVPDAGSPAGWRLVSDAEGVTVMGPDTPSWRLVHGDIRFLSPLYQQVLGLVPSAAAPPRAPTPLLLGVVQGKGGDPVLLSGADPVESRLDDAGLGTAGEDLAKLGVTGLSVAAGWTLDLDGDDKPERVVVGQAPEADGALLVLAGDGRVFPLPSAGDEPGDPTLLVLDGHRWLVWRTEDKKALDVAALRLDGTGFALERFTLDAR